MNLNEIFQKKNVEDFCSYHLEAENLDSKAIILYKLHGFVRFPPSLCAS